MSVCIISGNWAVVPYRMAPKVVIKVSPRVKLRYLNTRRLTSGWSVLNSHQTKPIRAVMELTVNHRTHSALNQSAS